MKRNKLLSLAMAGALSLSLAACGGAPTAAESKAPASAAPAESDVSGSDLAYVQQNGTLKIGYTLYEPMNYLDENGVLTGFETDFATAVCEKLGVEPEFVELTDWNAKIMEIDSKRIDCIWNGMTITSDLEEALSIGDPYIKNYQVAVIRSADADKFKTTADLAGGSVEAEAGSAGEAAIQADENLSKAAYTSVPVQANALLEVKTGKADACVLDFVMANAMVGTGDYSDLAVIPDLQLSVEEYGVGFRKDSDITPAFNKAMKELTEDGTMAKLAEQYELSELLLSNQK